MASLFIDTTYDITIGLLDDDLKWLDFSRFTGQKASAVIQKEAFNICQRHNIKLLEISALYLVAGPGFYTGLRLSEGLADVFKFFNIPCYSFYTYEIPAICAINSGVWMTKAYRGEYFFHHWDRDVKSNILIQASDLESYMFQLQEIYIHSDSALDDVSRSLIKSYKTTHELLKDSAPDVLSHVRTHALNRDSFYFRAPEDEFRVSV